MNILLVTGEALPFAKSGGLGDFITSYSKALASLGENVSVIMPLYKKVRDKFPKVLENYYDQLSFIMGGRNEGAGIFYTVLNNVTFYFVANNRFDREEMYGYDDDSERFALFTMAVNTFITRHNNYDVVHCNDWQCAVLPLLLKYSDNKKIKTVLTIHNPAYQGWARREDLENFFNLSTGYYDSGYARLGDSFDFLKVGVMSADKINTVSVTHAKELLNDHTSFGGLGATIDWCRHYDFSGIVNGLDCDLWDPKSDPLLAMNYNINTYKIGKRANKEKLLEMLNLPTDFNGPLISAITRLSAQKGVERMIELFPYLEKYNARMVIIGTGDMEDMFLREALKYRNVYFIKRYDENLAHLLYAASDFFLMPSYFEPCGTSQLISMRYGTLPIVSNVGGLNDTVRDVSVGILATGFVFDNKKNHAIGTSFDQACRLYNSHMIDRMIINGMKGDYSWSKSAKEYLKLYQSIDRK